MALLTVSDVLSLVPNADGVKDEYVTVSCPKCGEQRNLGSAAMSERDGYTVYSCPKDNADLVIVATTENQDFPGMGYRFANRVIGNRGDLFVSLPGHTPIKFPAAASTKSNS